MKHSTSIAILISAILFYIYASSNHNAQLEAMRYERQATVHEISDKLKSQGYKISFRITEEGRLAMVYPGNKKKIRADRQYDRAMNTIYGDK